MTNINVFHPFLSSLPSHLITIIKSMHLLSWCNTDPRPDNATFPLGNHLFNTSLKSVIIALNTTLRFINSRGFSLKMIPKTKKKKHGNKCFIWITLINSSRCRWSALVLCVVFGDSSLAWKTSHHLWHRTKIHHGHSWTKEEWKGYLSS